MYKDRHVKTECEGEAVGAVPTVSAAAHLALQLQPGYFKAKQPFFVYEQDAVRSDLDHIIRRHFPGRELGGAIGPPSKPTRLAQQRLILQLFDHHPCGGPAKDDGNHPPAPRGMVTRPGRHRRAQAVHATARSRTVGQGEARAGRVVAGRRWHLSGQDPQTEEPKDFGNKQLRQEVARRKRFQPLHCPLSTPGFSAPFSASHPPPFARAAARRAARSIARSPRTGRPPPSCAPAPRRRGAAPAVARPGCGWRCRRTRS